MEELEALCGQLLDDRYALHGIIGSGGSAVIFRGEDMLLRRAVAIKMLRSECFGGDADRLHPDQARLLNRQAFRVESRAAAMLTHPNIVSIYDVCPVIDHPYIVMELVHGESLSALMTDGVPLALSEILYICVCVLEALEEAHENGVIHRDLKAQNILITRDGQVKVADFGIAAIDGDTRSPVAGKVLGTADTMSPEQAAGEQIDVRSDIYSMGVLMYQMVTGHLPFENEDPQTVAFLHRTEPPRYPTTLNPALPRGVEQVILTALEKDPKNRFSSASAMLAAVRRLVRSPGHIFHVLSRKRSPLSRRAAKWPSLLPLMLGAGVAAVLLTLFFFFVGI